MISNQWRSKDPQDVVQQAVWHHNSGYTGEVWIGLPDAVIEKGEGPSWDGMTMAKVPMALLKAIVADWAREELKERLDEAEDDTVLCGTWPEGTWPRD